MIKIGTLFSGIGAPEQALKQIGIPHKIVYACDNDPYVKETYHYNYNCNHFYDNITKITKLPWVNLLVLGFPCQSFSLAGYGGGINDERGKLLFNALNLVKQSKPDNIILENVEGLVTKDKGKLLSFIENILRKMGYYVQSNILNSLGFGLPQHRNRLWIVATKQPGFKFPIPSSTYPSLSKFLSSCKNLGVYATKDFLSKPKVKVRLSNYGHDYINCITHTISRNGSSSEYISYVAAVNNAIGETRKPTVEECGKLFGFSSDFKFPDTICKTRQYNMYANSMPVSVLSALIQKLKFTQC